jgi:hypothetical protein
MFGLKDPAVYGAVIPASCVLAYLADGRKEDEYLVQLPDDVRPERVPESAWRPALEKHNAEREAADERERTEREHAECERRAARTPAQKKAEAAEKARHTAHCKKLNKQLDAYRREGHTFEEEHAFVRSLRWKPS